MSSFTNDELQIARMSREFRGEVLAGGATIHADIATRVAKLVYDDDIVLLGAGSWAAFDCDSVPSIVHDEFIARSSARGQVDWSIAFDFIRRDKLRLFVGPPQIDRHGSTNISVIGDWASPRTQLVGSRGLPDDLWRLSVIHFHVANHTPLTLVDQVHFVSAFGYSKTRDDLRCSTGKPGVLVTDLGVFTWPEEGGEMKVESLHPGVTSDTVRERTGFDIHLPGVIPETEPPTKDELQAIRELADPLELRHLASGGANSTGMRLGRLVADALVPLSARNGRKP